MNVRDVEQLYVREVYEQLAAQQRYVDASSQSSRRCRPWPNVREFLQRVPQHSILLDVGCGQLNYEIKNCFRIGVDACSEALVHSAYSCRHDVVLADGLHLPFRKECMDAALCVSVLHHSPSIERRVQMLSMLADALAPTAQLLLYVWAAEQSNASFPAQDVLVPWSLHEIPKNDLMPLVPFQRDSTKEQRIIRNSIPVTIVDDGDNKISSASEWLSQLLWNIQRKLCRIERHIPSAAPQFFRKKKVEGITKLLTGVNRWSPLLGSRLRLAMQSVEEMYANELSLTLVEEALAIALSSLQEITYYRYYHVFRSGELDALIKRCNALRVQRIVYDSANWCAVVEKSVELQSQNGFTGLSSYASHTK